MKPEAAAADFYTFAEQSGNVGKTAGMLKAAQAYLGADLTDFDRDPLAWAVENGTIKVRRGEDGWRVRFTPAHSPADRITRMASTRYDPEARTATVTLKAHDFQGETGNLRLTY